LTKNKSTIGLSYETLTGEVTGVLLRGPADMTKKIAKGDKVAMYYTSANRDEAVFGDSQTFDITRSPNPQLSFGIGEHFCLGVHLARLEGRIFFEELLRRFGKIEINGVPERVRSNLNNGVKRLPVTLSR
jgi:cytochrome P450